MNKSIKKLLILLLFTQIFFSCSSNDEEENNIDSYTIWDGPTITFNKADGADPTLQENQDRITSNVWITRGDNIQIYNIVKESVADKENSPVGTLWALGTLSQIESLSFSKFRATVGSPKDVVGKNLVMYLIDDNIYLSVKFTSWSQKLKGGFSYERSTKQ